MRLLRVIGILLLVLIIGTAGFGVYRVRLPFPKISGTLALTGLEAPVQVIRDEWGIPHVFAGNEHDVFFAQGFIHAQDRLWQMDFNRRIAAGRLSEIFGETTLQTDRFLRTVGLRRAAEAEWGMQDPDVRTSVEAYTAGINAFLARYRNRLPIEFGLLRYSPEPWTPIDSLAYGKLMAWVLSGNWESEILRAHLVGRFGPEGASMLLPGYPTDHPVIVPAQADYSPFRSPSVLKALDLAPRRTGIGSNNWVVAGARTTTGAPLLANDPHLEAAMPSIWYEMHLSGGGINAAGSTFPGTPGIIIGHNESIAWGVTNAGPDVQDLYIERFHPADPTLYLFRGQWEKVTIVQERIIVKGRPTPEILPVRITRHGPILNSVVEGLPQFLALRWTALEPGKLLSSLSRLIRAKNWAEFREALRLWTVPAQNFVYADRFGNIGYQLPGRIPIRSKGDGLLPVPGWTGEHEWTGEIPFEQLPSSFNPSRGYIVTANNRIAPEGYPFHLAVEWDPGFRARRIEALLTSKPKLSAQDFQTIQIDVASLPGRAIVEALRKIRLAEEPPSSMASGSRTPASLLNELTAWDGVLSPDSRAAAIYEAFRVALPELIFKDVLGSDLFEKYMGRSDAWTLGIIRLLNDPSSNWWGPDGRAAVVAKALERAGQTLTKRLGSDSSRWRWGSLHVMRFEHPIGQVPALGWIFNATAPPTGGDAYTVNNAGFDPDTFRQVAVASYRQIIDVANFDRSLGMHTTGQSGLPFHRHYKDFVPMWAAGRYHAMLFSRARIEEGAESTLLLTP